MTLKGLDINIGETILLLCGIVVAGVICSCVFLQCCNCIDRRAEMFHERERKARAIQAARLPKSELYSKITAKSIPEEKIYNQDSDKQLLSENITLTERSTQECSPVDVFSREENPEQELKRKEDVSFDEELVESKQFEVKEAPSIGSRNSFEVKETPSIGSRHSFEM